MARKRLLNKPAKGINQTSTNGLGIGRSDSLTRPAFLGTLGRHESRSERRAREAEERRAK